MSPFEYAKSVSENKNYLMVDEESEKAYIPYLINKTLSFHAETIWYANIMNQYKDLPKKLQYDYFYHAIPAKKRYNKWAKRKNDKILDLIQEYYQCNNQRAKEILVILSDEQIQIIRKRLEQGGISK